jgi:hypothetical protein
LILNQIQISKKKMSLFEILFLYAMRLLHYKYRSEQAHWSETLQEKRNIKKGAANPKESPYIRPTTTHCLFFSLQEATNTNTSQHPLSVHISATNTKKREISSIFLSR